MSDPEIRVRRALVSVSDKANLGCLAEILSQHGVEVLSTGGTYRALGERGVRATRVSDYTGAPEILDGRVKTLHPKIHGGILALPSAAHMEQLAVHGMAPIDLVVVNLYPFERAIARPGCSFEEAVENIDIGGPAMLRAAAKNWTRVCVVVDPGDYVELGRVMAANDGVVPETFRRRLARKAFAHSAHYDAAIATYLARRDDDGRPLEAPVVPPVLALGGTPLSPLRYGENPHQGACWFASDYVATGGGGLHQARQHQGKELSYNNLLDADAALALVRDLHEMGSAVAVVKHLSPCGAAIGAPGEAMATTYRRAREADSESAFGSIVALTGVVDAELAEALSESFLEVVLAPAYSEGALERLGRKSNLRLLELPNMFGRDPSSPALRVRSVAGALLVQPEDRVSVPAQSARCRSARKPTASEVRALDFAQRVAMHVRSNAIVLASDGETLGIGGGQTSRVAAVRQALSRAGERAKGAALASDAFFPFRDGVDLAAAAGVTSVIQPGGSRRDGEVFAAADEHGLAMLCTGERHFRH
ncbi:MAG: bifunctional phosphoribosylaminoimidazolecarboxamide formyltransferase/IMP cyclohydrolase [Nannocystaceae bacterium]